MPAERCPRVQSRASVDCARIIYIRALDEKHAGLLSQPELPLMRASLWDSFPLAFGVNTDDDNKWLICAGRRSNC